MSLAFGLGVWGSAVSINLNYILTGAIEPIRNVLKTVVDRVIEGEAQVSQVRVETAIAETKSAAISHVDQVINNMVKDTAYQGYYEFAKQHVSQERILPAQVYNWVPEFKTKYMVLVDAGIDFNVPLPPLLQANREVDVIIVNDDSGDLHSSGAGAFKKALNYAKSLNITYRIVNAPAGQDNPLDTKILTAQWIVDHLKSTKLPFVVLEPVVGELNSKAPLIIYMPLVDSSKQLDKQPTAVYSTFKATYSRQEAQNLFDIMYNKINGKQKYANNIREVINKFLDDRGFEKVQTRSSKTEEEKLLASQTSAPEFKVNAERRQLLETDQALRESLMRDIVNRAGVPVSGPIAGAEQTGRRDLAQDDERRFVNDRAGSAAAPAQPINLHAGVYSVSSSVS